jgi:hypothetical protein
MRRHASRHDFGTNDVSRIVNSADVEGQRDARGLRNITTIVHTGSTDTVC